jgi:hypothetical protein
LSELPPAVFFGSPMDKKLSTLNDTVIVPLRDDY